MIFKRGDKYICNKRVVTILGPEDFGGYEYNRPNKTFELVRDRDGKRGWVGNIHLKKIEEKKD